MKVIRRGHKRFHGDTKLFSISHQAIHRRAGSGIAAYTQGHRTENVREPGRSEASYDYEVEFTPDDICALIRVLAEVSSEYERRELQPLLKAIEPDLVRLLAIGAGFSAAK
jgi:hypothetical protein